MSSQIVAKAWTLLFLGLSIWLIATAISVAPDARGHGTHESLGMEPCPYLKSTGHPCPSCGMTTAFSHTVRFEFSEAFRSNPAGFLLALFTLAAPLWFLHSLVPGQPAFRFLHRRGGQVLVAAILILALSWWYILATWPGGP